VFFGRTISPIASVQSIPYDRIVITSYLKQEKIYADLLKSGVDKSLILISVSKSGGAS
jgi:hypothetical protein